MENASYTRSVRVTSNINKSTRQSELARRTFMTHNKAGSVLIYVFPNFFFTAQLGAVQFCLLLLFLNCVVIIVPVWIYLWRKSYRHFEKIQRYNYLYVHTNDDVKNSLTTTIIWGSKVFRHCLVNTRLPEVSSSFLDGADIVKAFSSIPEGTLYLVQV